VRFEKSSGSRVVARHSTPQTRTGTTAVSGAIRMKTPTLSVHAFNDLKAAAET
jgi:hypothetical protein